MIKLNYRKQFQYLFLVLIAKKQENAKKVKKKINKESKEMIFFFVMKIQISYQIDEHLHRRSILISSFIKKLKYNKTSQWGGGSYKFRINQDKQNVTPKRNPDGVKYQRNDDVRY